jgi:ABC-2 type transport system permease protein
MKYYWEFLLNEIRKMCCIAFRYSFNTVSSILFWAVLMILLTYHLSMGGYSTKAIYTFVSSFMIWQIVNFTFISVVDSILVESIQGTLEQLYLNSRSFYSILFIKGVSASLLSIIQSFVAILITIFFVPKLSIDFLLCWVSSLPSLILGIPAIIGLGIACASLALKYKNISSFYSMVSSIFFAVITYKANSLSGNILFSIIIPFESTNSAIQTCFYGIQSFSTSFSSYLYTTINSAIYIILGYIFLYYYEKTSKKNGVFSKF